MPYFESPWADIVGASPASAVEVPGHDIWFPGSQRGLTGAYGDISLSNTTLGVSSGGPAWVNALTTNCYAALVPSPPTSNVTIVLIGGITGTSGANGEFGVNSGTMGDRMGGHVPFTDGTVYWDFGGATAGSTRVSAGGLTITPRDVWAFTTGPRGMEIWQNGKLRASNSANPTRTNAAGGAWGIGVHGITWAGTNRAPAAWNGAALIPAQMPAWWLQQLSSIQDTWATLLRPRRTYIPLPTASTGLPTLSSATYVPGSLAASGFRPRVTATY